MKPVQPKDNKKQPYHKPRLRTIELAAEEVMANGCFQTGKSLPSDAPTCTFSGCINDAS